MHIHSLHVYPVKSCRGHTIETIGIEKRGFTKDRRYVVVDALADNKALTQRTQPNLARITPHVLPNGDLLFQKDGQADITVPQICDSEKMVTVWDDTVPAFDQGDMAAQWLQTSLGDPAIQPRLFYQGDIHFRPADYSDETDPLSFADGSPILLTSLSSLAEINTHKNAAVPMDRFRPNLVITGAPAFAEDRWETIQIGAVIFKIVNGCDRCKIVTLDQMSGEPDPRDDNTLKALITADRRGATGKLHFGMDMIPLNEGEIRVGDAINIITTHDTPLHLRGPAL